MTDFNERRSNLQRLVEEFPAELGDEIAVRWPISVYHRVFDGSITVFNWLTNSHSCGPANLLDVAGMASTRTDGSVTFPISDFICRDSNQRFVAPAIIVATSRDNVPVLLAARAQIPSAEDVVIEVRAWGLDGNPRGGVPFHWRCIVPTTSAGIE